MDCRFRQEEETNDDWLIIINYEDSGLEKCRGYGKCIIQTMALLSIFIPHSDVAD